jgi:Uma2 family endonuclease
MLMKRQTAPNGPIVYPDSDGKPLADNTKQLRWIITLVGNLKVLFRDRPDVFVGGDQLWYPVEGELEICNAPDAYVVFGRPKGDRSSYKQWEEGGVPMTVVFEVLSPGNTAMEMIDKHAFYEDYGVEEYYLYDPDTNHLCGYTRRGDVLLRVRRIDGFVSPRLGIRFDLSGQELVVRYPDGRPFLAFEEVEEQRVQAVQQAEQAQRHAEQADRRAEQAEQRAARLAELSGRVLQGTATPEDMQELQRLLSPPSSS